MFQPELIHESLLDALRDAIKAIGGSKVAGQLLRPTKSISDAQNWCNDCLNPDRRDKFDLDDVITILRKSREAGFHGAMSFIATECGYAAQPVEPADENARLQREFIAAVKQQQELVRRMERLNSSSAPPMRAVS